jgi:hypothetical protein
MKSLTAFRNVLKRQGIIENIEVDHLLCPGDELHFIIKFKFFPKKEGKTYESFLKARQESLKLLDKG